MSTLTHGSARRAWLSASRACVSSFSRAIWAFRAAIHSSRETIWCVCMECSFRVRSGSDEVFQIVEELDPAALVVVAGGLVGKLGVLEGEQRAGAVRLDRDRHQRLAFRGRVPGPAEHQPFVR